MKKEKLIDGIAKKVAIKDVLIRQSDLIDILEEYHQAKLKLLGIGGVVKSLPNDEEVKADIDTLPYYGTCTTEYNESFEDGVKWLKEQIACDCDRQPLRYNELGTCKYCGKQKPSEG